MPTGTIVSPLLLSAVTNITEMRDEDMQALHWDWEPTVSLCHDQPPFAVIIHQGTLRRYGAALEIKRIDGHCGLPKILQD